MVSASNLVTDSFGSISAQHVKTDTSQTQRLDILGSSGSFQCSGSATIVGPSTVIGTTNSSIAFFGGSPVPQPQIQLLDVSTGTPSVFDIAVKVNAIIQSLYQLGLIRES